MNVTVSVTMTEERLDLALRAVAEPRRRAILQLVTDRELPAGQIALAFPDVSRPAISQHLTVLREAGLVHERREGTKRLYRTDVDALRAMQRRMAELWPTALDRFKTHVESTTSNDLAEPTDPRSTA